MCAFYWRRMSDPFSRAVTALLERSHYAVDAVYDGHEALDYLESGNYDAPDFGHHDA